MFISSTFKQKLDGPDIMMTIDDPVTVMTKKKKKLMRAAAPATALLVALLAVPALAQKSTRQDFRDFCHAWEGRWVGSVTWVADIPGFGKRGEKVTAYADCRVAHDGNAMITKLYGGDGSATWIVVYDAGDKQIKGLWVTSGGVVSHSILYKKGEKWIEDGRGSQIGCVAAFCRLIDG